MPGDKELRTILADTCSRLFTAQVTPQLQESAEKGTWPEALWRQVEENGLTLPQVPESRGGAGGSWSDAHVVLTTAGRHAVPLPIAETMMGGWLLAQRGLDVPMGPITLAPTSLHTRLTLIRNGKGWRLEGSAPRVPWGRQAEHVVVAAEDEGRPMIALIARGAASVEEDVNLALEPRDTLTWRGAPVVAASPGPSADRLWQLGALARAAQMAGGLEYLLAQSVKYVTERSQFGRTLASFQAIQHQLALLAGHTAAAGMAAQHAFATMDARGTANLGEAAFERDEEELVPELTELREGDRVRIVEPLERARPVEGELRVGEAAGLGAGIAHQSHGAIGFTYEHSLHFVTRRLWSWRAEFGGESHWSLELGREVAARGAEALWPHLTSR